MKLDCAKMEQTGVRKIELNCCKKMPGSMKRVKGNGMSKKLLPIYPEEYFWLERNSRDEPIAFVTILSNIAGIYIER